MATALVIGLGTSGLHIIEECQQFHYQFTGKNKPDSVRYLYLETDVNQKPAATAMGKTDITPVYISLQNTGAHVATLQANTQIDHSWIPPIDAALAAGNGAGGNSSYGRLALWINYSDVRDTILRNWQQIHGDAYTYVFIVGTLTGGTGSGSCVDMAYLVRDITKSNNIFGVLLTPSHQQLSGGGTDALFYNYFSAITTIQHYSDNNRPYDVVWPDGTHYHNNAAPFEQCYFLSQDYTSMHAPMKSVNELYKVAGLHIFSRIHSFGEVDKQTGQELPHFSATIDRRMLDIKTNVGSYKFSTFGTKLIYYPKELLKEYFGIELSESVLKRWTDPKDFIDSDHDQKSIDSEKTKIQGEIKNQFEKNIIECLNVVDGQATAAGTNLLDLVTKGNVTDLLKKNYQAPSVNAYIYSLFSSRNASNHYATIDNNRNTIRDQFIKSIYELFVSQLDKYQNLAIGKLILETIANSIVDVLRFWKQEYQIDGNSNNWNRLLQQEIAKTQATRTLPTTLLQREAYYKEKFANLMLLCKMHVAVEALTLIQNTLNTGNVTLRAQTIELPTIPKVNSLIDVVSKVMVYNGNDSSVVTLSRRKNEISSSLTTNTPNFTAIFSHGSLKNDLDQLKMTYNNKHSNNKFGTKNITNQELLWKYLENIDAIKLYKDSIERGLTYVNTTMRDLQNVTIVNLIAQLKQTPGDKQWQAIKTFIEEPEVNIVKELPGQEELRSNVDVFQSHHSLKLIYLTGDVKALDPQMQNFKITAHMDNSCELAGLSDAIIIFQEYGYMGNAAQPFDPTINIGLNQTVRQRISANFDAEADSAVQPNVFVFKRRVPYLKVEEFKEYLK